MIHSLCFDANAKVVFSPAGPQPQFLAQDDKLKVLVAGLEAGQSIPSHPESLAVYYFLEGSGLMQVDDETFPVAAGATVITAEGARRGIQAHTRLAFLAVRVS
ncbi:MAG: cupin domain-containing protein [Anaerolineales bacterium]|nr:cupin domain-containing protein [Anaerolineales bacterium]